MPPQPLSSKRKKDPRFNFTPESIEERPDLAIHVAQSIAIWAAVETLWGRVLATMLGGPNASHVIAMYQSLTSGNAQRDAINAVAKKALSPDLYELFNAINTVATPIAKLRNKFAHWLWGISLDMPNVLLLYNPEEAVKLHHEVNEYTREAYALDISERHKLKRPTDNLDEILVFNKRDLESIVSQMSRIRRYIVEFISILQHTENFRKNPYDVVHLHIAQLIQRLTNEPDIQEALARQHLHPKKKKVTPKRGIHTKCP